MFANTLFWLLFQEEPSPLFIVGIIIVAILVYALCAYSMQVIAQKTNVEPGWWAWIPILQILLLLKVAEKPLWWIILFFVPIVSIVIAIMVWVAICKRRNKSPMLVIGLVLLPIVFLPYLAFSD